MKSLFPCFYDYYRIRSSAKYLIFFLLMLFPAAVFAQYPPAGFPVSTEFNSSTGWTLQNSAEAGYNFNSENILKLTTATESDKGFAYYNSSFPSNLGLIIEFTYYSQNGTGADGITFFLLEGDKASYSAGAYGGSLGYANGGTTAGITYGYVGIGFDEYGNFSNTDVGTGGPGQQPDYVVIRGSGNAATSDAYRYLTGTYFNGIDGGKRWVKILLSTDSHIDVYISKDGSSYTHVINNYNVASATGQIAKPSTFQMGFAASTGGSTNLHGIGKIDVKIPMDLAVTNLNVSPSTVNYGSSVTMTYRVINNGPNRDNSVRLVQSLPSFFTGTTWSYSGDASGSGSGNVVNISGLDLDVGEYIDVTVTGTAVSLASATANLNLNHSISVSSTNNAFGDTNTSNNTANVSFSYTQPVLSVSNPQGEVIAVYGGWQPLGSNVTLTPNAYKYYTSATVRISSNYQTGDQLRCTSLGGLSQSFSGGTLTLSGSADYSTYLTALQNIEISSSYQNPGGSDRIVGITYALPGYSTTGSMTFKIITNRPPVANNDVFSRFYTDTQLSYTFPASGVLANDSDPDGDAITVGIPRPASNVSNGTLSLNADGSFTYIPTNGMKEFSDSFTYYANDGKVNSTSTATVTINVYTPRFTGGGGNNNFSNPANWNCGYVPNESLNIVIAAGQTMIVDQNYTCKNLKFETGASFYCTNGSTLIITGDVLKSTGATAIDVNSSLQVKSSIQIQNP